MVDAAAGRPVKVIIETWVLHREEKERACRLVEKAGAQMVKTTTGVRTQYLELDAASAKGRCVGAAPPGAVVEDIVLLRQVLAPKMKIKASGGIYDLDTALAMFRAGADQLGVSKGEQLIGDFQARFGERRGDLDPAETACRRRSSPTTSARAGTRPRSTTRTARASRAPSCPTRPSTRTPAGTSSGRMDWWRAVVESTRKLLASGKADWADIECVSISGHSLGVVPLDRDGGLLRETTPIWSDTRSEKQTEELFGKVSEEEWYMTTGNGFPPPCYSVFKVMWYRDNEPDMFRRGPQDHRDQGLRQLPHDREAPHRLLLRVGERGLRPQEVGLLAERSSTPPASRGNCSPRSCPRLTWSGSSRRRRPRSSACRGR